MRTRRSYFPPTPRRSRKQTTNVVEPEFRTIVEMVDNCTMAQMLQAPIEGYEDAIVDALDYAAGGNFLDKIPRECLSIIESKSKVRYSKSRVTDVRANTNAPLSSSSPSNFFDLQSGITYKEPPIPPSGVEEQEPTEETTDTELPSTEDIQPPLVQVQVEV
nr:hypothetical protein [Tanacetum cinerariifolium]